MKPIKEVLEYYGKCCVTEYVLESFKDYPSGKSGEESRRKDLFKLEYIRGQKLAIEHILGGS